MIPIIHLTHKYWESNDTMHIRGTAFHNGIALSGHSMAEHLRMKIGECADWCEMLRGLNGFFACIGTSGSTTFAAVDRIRSIPLFYGKNKTQFFISDDAEYIRQKVGDDEMDPPARDEFLLAGYVTGQDTLYPNVKQLQAGELLEITTSGSGTSIETTRYYRFLHSEPANYASIELTERLEIATINSFKRLIEYANGRKIVIPLSGGYDSRLTATILKKLKYENILCFTYGIPGNREADYSHQVAKALGFNWCFVEYSENIWRSEWATSDADHYRKMSNNHSSLPHVQDWVAIKRLLKHKIIDGNSIIVPGHGGDFVAGSHIPLEVFDKFQHEKFELLDRIIKDHFSNVPTDFAKFMDSEALSKRIASRIDLPFNGTCVEYANSYEAWDWQERQAKYISNSVRVYDQFSLAWWMPLWDREFVEFWENAPLDLRKGREWYKNWVVHQYNSQTNNPNSSSLNNAADRVGIKKILFSTAKILPNPLTKFIKKIYHRNILNNHFLAFQGLVPRNEIKVFQKKGFNIIGMYSTLFLEKRWR